MKKKKELHSPTLASILMVESCLSKEEYIGKYQLWKKLPKAMMYQTLQLILKYLEKSSKITILKSKIIVIKTKKATKKKEKEAPSYVA